MHERSECNINMQLGSIAPELCEVRFTECNTLFYLYHKGDKKLLFFLFFCTKQRTYHQRWLSQKKGVKKEMNKQGSSAVGNKK